MSSNPIKVGVDLSCLIPQPLTGVGYYTLHLFRALLAANENVEVRAFATSARRPVALDWFDACPVRFTRWPTRLKTLLWTRFDWPPVERLTGPIDVAHGAFHLVPPSRRARRVVTIFDLSAFRFPAMHTRENAAAHAYLIRHAVSNADAIIAISESCKADLIDLLGVPEARIHVVYGGVDLSEFDGNEDAVQLANLETRLGIRDPYLIHLGTLEPRKNLPRLLDAYARVRGQLNDAPQLVLAGRAGWGYDAVFKRIADLNLGGAVVHTGYVSRADAVQLLRGAYACVYPSLYEGFGLPILEAMAAHTPVLTSNVSSMPEVIGDAGILVDPESVDAIEAGLLELIGHPDAARLRADAAYQRAKQFTWERSARALADVYRAVAAEGRR